MKKLSLQLGEVILLYRNSNHMRLTETKNLDLFLLQNAREGGHENHNSSPVPKDKSGLIGQTDVMRGVPATKQHAHDQGK